MYRGCTVEACIGGVQLRYVQLRYVLRVYSLGMYRGCTVEVCIGGVQLRYVSGVYS